MIVVVSTDGRRGKPLAFDLNSEELRVQYVDSGNIGYMPLFDIRGVEMVVDDSVLTIRFDKMTSWNARAVNGEDTIGRWYK